LEKTFNMKKKSNKRPVQAAAKIPDVSVKNLRLREGLNLKNVADNLGIKARVLIEQLQMKRYAVNVNDLLTETIAETISNIFQINLEVISLETYAREKSLENPKQLVIRPPVVTIMGHVDHGKTTLLDAIRESNLVNRESGGITQHIGAYQVEYKERSITFVDTPGHEAFTKLRARGAMVTDIVILIVAADDGVMPQTKEAIAHAKAAEVPILVAINKIDKPEADIERTKQQLSQEGLLVEDWGGDIVSIDISAKKKKNIGELLEMLLLLTDVTEIMGNPHVNAQGVILEARLDPRKGAVATVIIQNGILQANQAYISGTAFGRSRALFDENGRSLKEAGLSMPVEVLGFSEVPQAGDFFHVVDDLDTAKRIAEYRLNKMNKPEKSRSGRMTLDQLFEQIEDDSVKELSLIVKADVHGSVEVLRDTLSNLSTDKVKIEILHSACGKITDSDVLLASTSNSIILGYNVKPSQAVLDLAREEKVEIRSYNVIYQLTDDIKKAQTGMLDPEIRESYMGRAEVRKLFRVPKAGTIAGCYVSDGVISRNATVKVIRSDKVVHTGKISSLKHLKNNVTEVKKDLECGIGLANFKDIQPGDRIEAFTLEEIIQK